MTTALQTANEFFGIEVEKFIQPDFVYTDEMFFNNCKKSTLVIQDKRAFSKDYIKSYMLILSNDCHKQLHDKK